jgi:hypothetical protein
MDVASGKPAVGPLFGGDRGVPVDFYGVRSKVVIMCLARTWRHKP